MYNIDTVSLRHRIRTNRAENGVSHWGQKAYNEHGTLVSEESGQWPVPLRTKVEEMWDNPTKNFKKLSAEGMIINSPMLKKELTVEHSVFAASVKTTFPGGAFSRASGTEFAAAPPFTLDTPERLIDDAVTKAFAEVSANKQNALLWAGEARESVKMFYDIGKRLYQLVISTAKQRLAYLKGKLSLKEAQSMTLGILYGLMPLSEALAQWREGLLEMLPKGRQTFRGFNKYSDSVSYTFDTQHSHGSWKNVVSVEETIESNIRAGVLVDIDPPDSTVYALLEPRSIVSTAYALSRLSFVVDWFIGVGNWLCSWSPTVGTKILSSWVVVETVQQVRAKHVFTSVLNRGEASEDVSGSGTTQRLLKQTLRVPVNPSDRPYLPSINVNLNIDKIFALILLFGKTSK